MKPLPGPIAEAPAPAEDGYTTYSPIQWEQRRDEVRMAIVTHRWAALKIRKLSREQAAIDWGCTVEKRVWEWARGVGMRIFRIMFLGGVP